MFDPGFGHRFKKVEESGINLTLLAFLVILVVLHVQMADFAVGWESDFPVKNVRADDIILKRSQTIRATILHCWSFMLKTTNCLFVCLIWGLVTLVFLHVQMADFAVGWESDLPVKNVSTSKTDMTSS